MNDKIKQSIKMSRNITILGDLSASVFFLIAYLVSGEFWYLVVTIVLFVSCISFIPIFKWIEGRMIKQENTL